MLNTIWGLMLIFAVIFGALSGRMADVTHAAISGAGEGVSLLISMLGLVCFWSGLMEIAERSGVVRSISRLFRPVLKWIFPRLSAHEPAMQAIVMNLSANLLGMGNAATPLGLRAMRLLDVKNGGKKRASNEMCMFVLINTASLQILPTTLLLFRQEAGSQNPAAVLPPIWLVSVCALLVAILCARLLEKRR